VTNKGATNNTDSIISYINTETSNLTLQNLTITGAKADVAGIFATGDIIVESCDISKNDGIGLYSDRSVTIHNSTIADNNNTGFITKGSELNIITNTTIARNKNSGFKIDGAVNIYNSSIIDNTTSTSYANVTGGGFYAGRDVYIVDSNVSGNYLYGSGSSYGAGFYTQGYATVINSTFSYNEARAWNFYASGGAFYVNRLATVKDCNITHNTLSSQYDGTKGAGFLAAIADVKNTIFSDNIAKRLSNSGAYGGGFYV